MERCYTVVWGIAWGNHHNRSAPITSLPWKCGFHSRFQVVKDTPKEIDCFIASSFGQFGMLFQNVSQKGIVKLPFVNKVLISSQAYQRLISGISQGCIRVNLKKKTVYLKTLSKLRLTPLPEPSRLLTDIFATTSRHLTDNFQASRNFLDTINTPNSHFKYLSSYDQRKYSIRQGRHQKAGSKKQWLMMFRCIIMPFVF